MKYHDIMFGLSVKPHYTAMKRVLAFLIVRSAATSVVDFLSEVLLYVHNTLYEVHSSGGIVALAAISIPFSI